MNKKCGKCGWRTDKCNNPNNIHYNQFRDKEDRCSVNVKKTVPCEHKWDEYRGVKRCLICGYYQGVNGSLTLDAPCMAKIIEAYKRNRKIKKPSYKEV